VNALTARRGARVICRRRWLNAALLASFCLVTLSGAATALTPQEQRGKHIYTQGSTPTGESIMARLGAEAVAIPASAVPCAGCHGADGLGRPEGGVLPPAITWHNLTKDYGHRHPYGRHHPGFDEASLAVAITRGIDPAGNMLDTAMPRYALQEADMADLLAYLRRLAGDSDPGLDPVTIRLGTILPLHGPLASHGIAMGDVMQAYFSDINKSGGIYGRKIKLEIIDSGGDRLTTLRMASQLLAGNRVFALVGPVIAGLEKEIARLAEEERVPQIGPFTLYPRGSLTLNRYTFYLFGGMREQLQALLEYAASELRLEQPQIAIIYPDTDEYAAIAGTLEAECRQRGWTGIKPLMYLPGRIETAQWIDLFQRNELQAVFSLGGGEGFRYATRLAEEQETLPYFFLPGSVAAQDLLDLSGRFRERIFLAYPTLPLDQTSTGLNRLGALRRNHQLGRQHESAQISAYTAARLLVEGLKRVGRDISREKLVSALESLSDHETGLTPPLSFSAVRRIGALGAHIVAADTAAGVFRPVGTWVDVAP
jgi:ABC-type branched-subunit amino acid transport system substrate-binding protein